MRRHATWVLAVAILATGCGRHATIEVDAPGDLAAAVAAAPDRATLRLGPGEFTLAPGGGLNVEGKSLNLIGAGKVATRIVSTSGEGIRFSDSRFSALQDLTLSGGGVTVIGGQLTLSGVRIAGGLVGLTSKEGARAIVRGSEIVDSTQDGIVVGRDAGAVVEGSLVDGVDGGSGVAIRAEEGSRLTVVNSVVRRHLDGIEVGAGGSAEIHGSVIEEIGTWGIALAQGARCRVGDNIVFRTGGCGATVPVGADNIFLEILGGPTCPQAVPATPPVAKICGNLPGLPYGTATSLYARFCYDSGVMSPS